MTECGECVITQIYDPERGVIKFRIERADPVIRIAPSVLAQIRASDPPWPATFDGKVLRIGGINQTVVYRVRETMEPVPGHPGYWDYIGEWPD